MSKAVQRRRGTTAEHTTFTGALGELTVDTTKDTVVVHDGAAAGGYPLAREDLNNVSEIPVSKLADGAARQLLQTAANGTDVEWTNNVDVPGTLDVTGLATFDNNVTIAGDLTVNGATTTINSTIVTIDDKLIELGSTATPTDAGADQGGIVLKGTTDKSFKWVDATDAWTSSEHVDLASGKAFYINGTQVLSGTALGSGVLITSTNITNGTIVNDDINASAGIVDTKLATISTSGKVSNSATTATNANTPSTIVARDGSGNFTAGTITAALTGAASSNVLKAGDTMTGVLAVTAGTAALPSVAISGDTNTGLYSPGADQAAITTGGTQKFTIDSLDGNAIIENSFPTIRPSLDLAFALTKVLDPRITFTRSSDGTYVDANGVLRTATTNIPRFDHNPATGESLGLLVEEQRTNLLLRSEEFDNASWTKVRASISANAITAPNGTLTADTAIEDASSSNTHNPLIQDATIVANGTYTASLYVRAKERSRGAIDFSSTDSANYVRGDFNLSTGTITTANNGTGSGASASISNVGSGWFRVSITGSIGSSLTTGRFVLRMADATGSVVYTGDGTSGIYLWGAQLEAGAFPTSYIPTTTAAATRSADVASITGTAFSSWYRPGGGSVFTQSRRPVGVNNTGSIFAISDGSFSNFFRLRQDADNVSCTLLNATSGVTDGTSFVTVGTAGLLLNIASVATSNDYQIAVQGVLGAQDTSATVAVVDRLEIGSLLGATTAYYNGHIRRLTYWPARLPNTTLQALTK